MPRSLSKRSEPHWWMALAPIMVLVAVMFFVIRAFGADAIGGASQIALICAAGVGIAISVFVYGNSWKALENAIEDNIKGIGSAILILFMIGALSSSWMISGIVPTLICYGLEIISPAVFLPTVCIICALISIMTGSSWTTIATIGVAMIGIGDGMGYDNAWTAGAIISGSYFGDKISPLSDTTVLASSSAGTPLFRHIKYMLITTVPSFAIALIVFTTVSLLHGEASDASMTGISTLLQEHFNLSGWLMIVPVITGILIAKRVPAFLTLMTSSILAGITAIIAQPEIVAQIGEGSLFKGIVTTFSDSTSIETGNEACNALISTSGMNGMLPTVFLIICAATFGGVLTGSGMLQSLTKEITRHVKTRLGTVSSTVTTGIFANIATGDQYLSIILTCNLYKKLYKDNNLEERLLSRSVEDSATVTSVLIPWNSCGMTQATVLGVATLSYLPYCIFNLVSPLMSILVAATGYKIFSRDGHHKA